MPHIAFNPITVIEKLPLKIAAIEPWGNKLIVGTEEGVLFIYEVKEKPDGKGYNVALLEAQKTFAKKPVTQLTAIEDLNILLSLSDGFISVHELPSFNLKSVIAKSKGCHLYEVQKTRNSLLVCVAIKRKISILAWDAKNSDFIETKELAIPDQARTLLWCGDSICIGFRKEYNMINVQTGAMTELFPTGRGGTPIATLLPGEQILLGRDNASIFLGYDGKPTRRFGLLWTENPLLVGASFPYAIAILPRFVEVRAIIGNQGLVQTLQQVKAPKYIAVKKNDIYIAAQGHVWKLLPIPLMNQVDQLISEKEYEEALTLCENIADSPEKDEKTKSIKILFTYHLFFQGQFDRAMNYFHELECSPLLVMGLYPNLLPKDVLQQINYPIVIPELVGPAHDKALQSLVTFLNQLRPALVKQRAAATTVTGVEEEYANTTDLMTIVDTSMVKALLKTNAADLAGFLKRPNYCHIKECENFLTRYNKFYELVMLYQNKGMHRLALELLAKLGQGVKSDTGVNSSTASGLYGPAETINYLKTLGRKQLDLILEFSRWVLQINPEEALAIFTENRSDDEALPPVQILAHIRAIAPRLVVPYLEWAISVGKETAPEFHNDLIYNYLEMILQLKKDPVSKSNGLIRAGQEPGILGTIRRKLLVFLDESKYYNPEKMLSKFPFDDLYEERALLLSRIDEHDKALQIYAHKLKDHKMAELYCAKHYNRDKEEARDVYLSLFKVYLRPSEDDRNAQVMVKPALALLNNHYQQIDLPKALELLPGDTPINELYNVFESALRDNSKNRRNNQIIKNLLKSENLQIKEQLINARSRKVKITDDRICTICNKRVGSTVFACYPNGLVVHFYCMKNVTNANASVM